MFWKKKPRIDVQEDPKDIDNRAAFRISPEKRLPIILTINSSPYTVINVSGTGVCFRSTKVLAGSKVSATVRLPSESKPFPAQLEVVSSEGGLCRCRFVDIHIEAQNLLHAYILNLQKQKIRRNQSR
ncbi:MAG: PilZ domain-containing protein [Gammaproteobacteria bacterium]|nr:PilZ domain-containing protein [Gammaproteobacteria bacterium]